MIRILSLTAFCLAIVLPARAGDSSITVYSGRSKNLVGPVIEKFEAETGVKVMVRYGGTAELATTILEEGARSPADVFYAQDAGALGQLADAGRLRTLPENIVSLVPDRFRSRTDQWVGVSGRARVTVYNTRMIKPEDLPASLMEFTDPKWKGKIGWAPTNGSFQAHVTAIRRTAGEEAAAAWLRGMLANEPKRFPNNSSIVAAVGAGEIPVGLVNHYYLFNLRKEKGDDFPAENHYSAGGDIGALINVSGAAVLGSTRNAPAALRFVSYLLSNEAQSHFARETFEYPLVKGIKTDPKLLPLEKIRPPEIDLGDLSDLKGTLGLLQEVGALD